METHAGGALEVGQRAAAFHGPRQQRRSTWGGDRREWPGLTSRDGGSNWKNDGETIKNDA